MLCTPYVYMYVCVYVYVYVYVCVYVYVYVVTGSECLGIIFRIFSCFALPDTFS